DPRRLDLHRLARQLDRARAIAAGADQVHVPAVGREPVELRERGERGAARASQFRGGGGTYVQGSTSWARGGRRR
ncbi:MAG: hypothetical protein ACKVXR_14760, partial [Planctomycetota bacterium]